jgi:hypothetical protein
MSSTSAWTWVDNICYFGVSAYCIWEWLRFVFRERKIFTVQTNIILLSAVWCFALGATGLLNQEINTALPTCYPRELLNFTVSAFSPLLIYSLILLFFVECYVLIRTRTDRYKVAIYCAHFAIITAVYLGFAVYRYVGCYSENVHAQQKTNSSSDYFTNLDIPMLVCRLCFFAAGLVVFFLLRRLRTVILTAHHDEVRSRFSRVLFMYLPAFLGRFVFGFVAFIAPSWKPSDLEIFLSILIIDVLPTCAVVFSFRSRDAPESTEPIMTYYHKEENEASWENFSASAPINADSSSRLFAYEPDYYDDVSQTP